MSKGKRSVYFGDPISTLLERVGGDNVSGTLNTAVARYLHAMDTSRPALTVEEWSAICDMLNGTLIDDDMWTARAGRLLAMEMEDAGAEPWGKWGIDGPALVAKLNALTPVEGLAVLHVVERFWADPESGIEAVVK